MADGDVNVSADFQPAMDDESSIEDELQDLQPAIEDDDSSIEDELQDIQSAIDDDSSIESYEDLDVPLQQKLNDVDLSFSRKTKMVELDGPVRTIQFRKKSLSSRAA